MAGIEYVQWFISGSVPCERASAALLLWFVTGEAENQWSCTNFKLRPSQLLIYSALEILILNL